MKKFQNIVANTFLFFGILLMFAMLVFDPPYWVMIATLSAICYTFALVLYQPIIRQETKTVDLKEEEVLRLLNEFEEYDRKKYADKQIG